MVLPSCVWGRMSVIEQHGPLHYVDASKTATSLNRTPGGACPGSDRHGPLQHAHQGTRQ